MNLRGVLAAGILLAGPGYGLLASSTVIQLGETGVSYPVTDFGAILLQDRVSGADASVAYFVEVTLKITAGAGGTMFASDYFVDLRHNTGSTLDDSLGAYRSVNLFQDLGAVADPFGFGSVANGIEIRLKDSYPIRLRDVSDYTSTAALTGNWQAYEALDPLGLMDPNGVWGLFVSDTSIGGAGVLTEWTVTLTPVPEPVLSPSLWAAVVFGVLGVRRRSGKSKL